MLKFRKWYRHAWKFVWTPFNPMSFAFGNISNTVHRWNWTKLFNNGEDLWHSMNKIYEKTWISVQLNRVGHNCNPIFSKPLTIIHQMLQQADHQTYPRVILRSDPCFHDSSSPDYINTSLERLVWFNPNLNLQSDVEYFWMGIIVQFKLFLLLDYPLFKFNVV